MEHNTNIAIDPIHRLKSFKNQPVLSTASFTLWFRTKFTKMDVGHLTSANFQLQQKLLGRMHSKRVHRNKHHSLFIFQLFVINHRALADRQADRHLYLVIKLRVVPLEA